MSEMAGSGAEKIVDKSTHAAEGKKEQTSDDIDGYQSSGIIRIVLRILWETMAQKISPWKFRGVRRFLQRWSWTWGGNIFRRMRIWQIFRCQGRGIQRKSGWWELVDAIPTPPRKIWHSPQKPWLSMFWAHRIRRNYSEEGMSTSIF